MEEWLEKMRRWCSRQERCTHDAGRKLQGWGVDFDTADAVVQALLSEGFLSDERYLESYVRTHVEHKRWGPRRVVQGLRQRGFSSREAEAALDHVSAQRFREVLRELVARRAGELDTHRERVIRFLLGRGFVVNEVLSAIEEAEER